MPDIPDSFELVAKGRKINVRTQASSDEIRIGRVNLTADQAAALARLVNLNDGETDLLIEIKRDT
jgi:hypothetical protein